MDEKSKREVMGIIVERAAEKGGTHFWRDGIAGFRPSERRRARYTARCRDASRIADDNMLYRIGAEIQNGPNAKRSRAGDRQG
jgi:hypothetical protein